MSDAPERIWACMGGPMVGMFVSGGNNGGWPEYIRADAIEALTTERDRLREALTDAGAYLDRGLDKMAFNIIRAALKGETP